MKHFTKLLAAAALLLFSQASFSASFTAADGNTWLQLSDTAGLSYSDVAAACSTGTCGGITAITYGFSGYTFATNADVATMFNAYAGSTGATPLPIPSPFSDPLGFYTAAITNVTLGGLQGSGYATDFGVTVTSVSPLGMYGPTFEVPDLFGFSSDSAANYAAFGAFLASPLNAGDIAAANAALFGIFGFGAPTVGSIYSALGTVIAGTGASFSGAYLYKTSAVPVPAALFMFAPALLGFFGLRRKTKVQA